MIVQATIEDLDDVDLHSLGMAFYKESKLPGEYIPSVFRTNWQRFFELGFGSIFLAKTEGKVVGAIGGLVHPDPYDNKVVAQEMFWFVSPSARGSITAVRLFEAFETWAKSNKAERLLMGCVCNHMMASLRSFYERKGFAPKEVSYCKQL